MRRFAIILAALFALSLAAVTPALAHEPYRNYGYGGYGYRSLNYGGPLPGSIGYHVPRRVNVGYRSVGGYAPFGYNNYGGYGYGGGYDSYYCPYESYGGGYGYAQPGLSIQFGVR